MGCKLEFGLYQKFRAHRWDYEMALAFSIHKRRELEPDLYFSA
jgi:hypothetical protein